MHIDLYAAAAVAVAAVAADAAAAAVVVPAAVAAALFDLSCACKNEWRRRLKCLYTVYIACVP